MIHGVNYAPEFIGVGKYTTELAAFLAKHHHVEVVTAQPHYPGWTVTSKRPWRFETSHEGGIRVTRCPIAARPGGKIWRLLAPLSFAITAAPVVFYRILKTRPQVVLCVEPTLFSSPVAVLAAKMVGARTVLHVQDLEIDAAFATGYLSRPVLQRAAKAVEKLLLRRFAAVVTISDAMAARLRDRGVRKDRVSVIRNWIDPRKLLVGDRPADVRKTFGLGQDGHMILYAGNLGAKQGLPTLIEAARHLRADPDIRIVVAGDGPMAPRLRAAAASLPNLTVVGLVPPECLGTVLASADLHVVPQDRATTDLVFPSKLGALLVSGKPILVTVDPGSELATWLDNAAILAPPGDGRALADAIRASVRRPSLPCSAQRAALVSELDADAILSTFESCLLPPDLVAEAIEAVPGFSDSHDAGAITSAA